MALFDPASREKFRRFRRQRRAWVSLLLLAGIFLVSLFCEGIANDTPRKVRFEGRIYHPRRMEWYAKPMRVFGWELSRPARRRVMIPQDVFLGDGIQTPPDYRALEKDPRFTADPSNRMWWAPLRMGPRTTFAPGDLDLGGEMKLYRRRRQHVAALRVLAEGGTRVEGEAGWFFGAGDRRIPGGLGDALAARFADQAAPELSVPDPSGRFDWDLSAYEPRGRAPRSVRVVLRERMPPEAGGEVMGIGSVEAPEWPPWWGELPEELRVRLRERMAEAREVPTEPLSHTDAEGVLWEIGFLRETVQFPFRPVKGHALGLDESGRDVLVNLLYATRISLLFGFLLVLSSMVLGTLIGGLQGYVGGVFDLVCQRLIEIYEAIPFLYAMILVGSIFGKSFSLLLFIYAVFNWIGLSYYMRAEFLKLRSQPFTEAARALGLPPGRIMWKHILPNAMVPLITFFPFSLVGAIGSLSALDYLGFGLPAGTPSWGDLLRQAQTYRHAWWLIAYPSLTLFAVILLCVFIGEGLRNAFDPKKEAHWEA